MSEASRIAVLESQFKAISEYMQDGRVWREETTIKLTQMIANQENYQHTCDSDRKNISKIINDNNEKIDVRIKPLEVGRHKQAGKTGVINAGLAIAISFVTAMAAARYGR